MKVSIIIPVYNAAGQLEGCLESLRRQTYPDVEVCFVDDCSTDGSLPMLEAFRAEAGRDVIICHHAVNRGAAAARNTGLDAITGDCVCWLDADDRLEDQTIAKAVQTMEQTDCDIVGWEWWLAAGQCERYMKQRPFSTPLEALKNMMAGVMRWNLWLFMVRRSLYEEGAVRFTDGMDMGEDMALMTRLFLKARRVTLLPEGLYHYAQTESSVSNGFSEKTVRQVTHNVQVAVQAVTQSEYAEELSPYIDYLKLNIKLPLLISDRKADYRQWASWFTEADNHVMQNKALPLRTRLLQQAAAYHQWWAVRLYNWVAYKVVYRMIYK